MKKFVVYCLNDLFVFLQLTSVLTCPQHISRFMRKWDIDPCFRPYIIRFGFYDVYRIGHITLDWGLITSLVERWHPKTHIFHLPIREMTIILQDVAIILGLCIHGLPITGTCDIDWSLQCYELLGMTPLTSKIKGSTISI